MKLGSSDISKVYLGSTEVSKAYLGSTLVHGNLLPYDAEVEWLESTGTQYIDTGIVPNFNTEVKVKAIVNDWISSGVLVGSRTGTTNDGRFFVLAQSGTNSRTVMAGSSVDISNTTLPKNTLFEIVFNETSTHKVLLNGSLITTFSSGNTVSENNNLLVFATSGYLGNLYPCKGKMCAMQIRQNGTLVRDYIMVRKDGVGYFYDRVSGQLYGNAGSDSFGIGADKGQLSYISNGLIAMWDGINNAGVGVHDNNATTWKDLISGEDSVALPETASFTSDHLVKGTGGISLMADATSLFSNVTAVTLETYQSQTQESTNGNLAHSVRVSPLSLSYGGYRYVSNNANAVQGTLIYTDRSSYNAFKNGSTWTAVKTFIPATKTYVVTNLSSTTRTWNGYYNAEKFSSLYSGSFTSATTYGTNIGVTGAASGSSGLYSVRIYNRALSASEIDYNHTIDELRFRNT